MPTLREATEAKYRDSARFRWLIRHMADAMREDGLSLADMVTGLDIASSMAKDEGFEAAFHERIGFSYAGVQIVEDYEPLNYEAMRAWEIERTS
jgi:hypothetical protein